MYLPVRFKSDKYEHLVRKGTAFTAKDSRILDEAYKFIAEQLAQEEAATKNVTIKPHFDETLIGKQVSIIDAINHHYEWDSLLRSYGYKRQGRAYLPPESSSMKAGAYILTSNKDGRERYYSHHESDPCSTGKAIDQFDFIVIRSYAGDARKALREIAETHFSTLDKYNKKEWAINQQNEKNKSLFKKVANS